MKRLARCIDVISHLEEGKTIKAKAAIVGNGLAVVDWRQFKNCPKSNLTPFTLTHIQSMRALVSLESLEACLSLSERLNAFGIDWESDVYTIAASKNYKDLLAMLREERDSANLRAQESRRSRAAKVAETRRRNAEEKAFTLTLSTGKPITAERIKGLELFCLGSGRASSVVYHIPSGFSLIVCNTKTEARKAAQTLSTIAAVDWKETDGRKLALSIEANEQASAILQTPTYKQKLTKEKAVSEAKEALRAFFGKLCTTEHSFDSIVIQHPAILRSDIVQALISLEMEDFITQLPGNRFQLKR